MPKAHSLAEFEAMLRAAIPVREFWVHGDPVDGYLSYNLEEACVMGLYAAQPGSGAGRALLAKVREGRQKMWLWSHAANTRAHAFYRREGFDPTGQTRQGADGLAEIEFHWQR